ncbi:hypothetical protein ACFQ51_39130 [Streptomyces kaempferi]
MSEINGRARGAGSEFVLATDIRFAGPTAILGQFEVGVGSVPGGNPSGRCPTWWAADAPSKSCWAPTTSRPTWRRSTAMSTASSRKANWNSSSTPSPVASRASTRRPSLGPRPWSTPSPCRRPSPMVPASRPTSSPPGALRTPTAYSPCSTADSSAPTAWNSTSAAV